MANQRVDLLFQSESGYGWTESYYYIPGGLTLPTADITTLVADRAGLLANDCFINYIRIASGWTRSPYLFDAGYPIQAPVTGSGGGPSGVDFVALVLRLQGVAPGVGRLFMRGVPEAQYEGDAYTPSPFYASAMQDFTNDLKATGKWAIRTSTTNAVVDRFPVTTLTPLSPRGYQFSSITNLALVAGNKIRMHQAVEIGYNGLKQVTGVGGVGPFIYAVGGAAPTAADSGANNPYITIPAYQYVGIGSAIPERITRRSPGRFFGQRRGRRSTTLSLRR